VVVVDILCKKLKRLIPESSVATAPASRMAAHHATVAPQSSAPRPAIVKDKYDREPPASRYPAKTSIVAPTVTACARFTGFLAARVRGRAYLPTQGLRQVRWDGGKFNSRQCQPRFRFHHQPKRTNSGREVKPAGRDVLAARCCAAERLDKCLEGLGGIAFPVLLPHVERLVRNAV
jgi:hypothetical protein